MSTYKVEIVPYNEDTFAELLYEVNVKATPLSFIKNKNHLAFFKEFFGSINGVNASYIVIEQNYISKDYLSDYSSYYSTCFKSYSKVCCRLHFFKSDKDLVTFKNDFENIIGGAPLEESDKFWNCNYIGYIVIKPIPNNFIGFTLLRHYNSQKGQFPFVKSRIFWGTRNYKVHVFGSSINVHSLAFQEQDRNVAACATIAIWTMLQRAAENYYVILKSPSEITLDTGSTNFDGNRLMPNEGLTLSFMANAISKNNLVTEIRQSENHIKNFNSYVKKLIHAYSPLKVPIILAMRVPNSDRSFSGHAVSICGHNIESVSAEEDKSTCIDKLFSVNKRKPLFWTSEKIDKLYVHDDQWGPFSRLTFIGEDQIKSSWSEHRGIPYLAELATVMICLYPKVRISYDRIEAIILGVDWVLKLVLQNLLGNLVWDVQLNLSEKYKHDLKSGLETGHTESNFSSIRYHILTKNFPKYIWVVKLFVNNLRVFDFIYDATGLVHSDILHTVLGYFPIINDGLLEYLQTNKDNPYNSYPHFFGYSVDSYIDKLSEIKSITI